MPCFPSLISISLNLNISLKRRRWLLESTSAASLRCLFLCGPQKTYLSCPRDNNLHQWMPPLSPIEGKKQGVYFPAKTRWVHCIFHFLDRSATEFSQNIILLFWTISSSPNVTTNMQQSTGKRWGHKRIPTMAFALSSYLWHNALPHTQQLLDLLWLHLGKREGSARKHKWSWAGGVHLVCFFLSTTRTGHPTGLWSQLCLCHWQEYRIPKPKEQTLIGNKTYQSIE